MSDSFLIDPFLETAHPVQRCGWPDCGAACCMYGAWVDQTLAEDILQHADLIAEYMSPDLRPPKLWFDGRVEPDEHALSGEVAHTTVLPNPDHYGGTACIFLRPDQQCALQTAAQENGLHPWRFKPFYCILHPMEIKEGRITLDDPAVMVGEPASCLRRAETSVPLVDIFHSELDYFLGD
ncbi:MAG TPA: hypothetical protein VJ965_11910 [Anaerolineales bacterium]|nr:hypothetical protein [Anaerolineales bacterium]